MKILEKNQNIQYKDLQCMLIKENSKKYLIIDENENLSQENIYEKAKKYGFEYRNKDKKFILEVFNLYEDYNLDEGTLYSASIGRFILSDSEIIYAFQMDGCGSSSRYWQITYEEYINYKSWKDDNYFIRQIVDKRPYLDTYFSQNDLFKIVKQCEREGDKEYFLQYAQEPTDIIRILIRDKKDKQLKFFQMVYKNLSKVDVDEMNDIFSSTAHLYYNGYISDYEWDRECWSETLNFRDSGKIIAYRELKNSEQIGLKAERDALKSIILEIDKRDLIDATNKAIALAQEYINDNIYTEFMNTLIKNYTLAEGELEIVTGGCRAYSYSCPYIGDNREKELLKAMEKAEQIYQRLLDNRKKYDFFNSYYNKDRRN